MSGGEGESPLYCIGQHALERLFVQSHIVRRKFLDYFKNAGHTIVKSSSLIPFNDPTLLFTNAGMVQFKEIFLGEKLSDYSRAVTSQKCVRAGGKHNDLENVGHTARHHTFFEMLGNFSFGDYFKKDAIHYAWDFLTNTLGLPKDRLYVTVFETDDEAYGIWENDQNIPRDRLLRFGEKDNFWSMGDTGPCGPCSEILYDQGEGVGCATDECKPGCDCDRYLEIWNLVFMQYNRDAAGKMTPLPKPSIDTGMGLERLTAVMQNVTSNYDTDLFTCITDFVKENIAQGKELTAHDKVTLNVIADHARAVTFLIADGVLPSNEGSGYVLRRIIMRASRHAKMLGFNEPFLFRTANVVIDKMKDPYIELVEKRNHIANVVKNEEERFSETPDNGLKILNDEVEKLKENNINILPGDVVFKLYDTYGFPIDLTADILKDEELVIDSKGFYAQMNKQKQRSKSAWSGTGANTVKSVYKDISMKGVKSEFTGYKATTGESQVLCLIKDGKEIKTATAGDEVEIITSVTPFFGESGGQAGDIGVIRNDSVMIRIIDTAKPIGDLHVNHGKIERGAISEGDTVTLEVMQTARNATARNHSATHLLQAALRKVLGDHVNQAGSYVTKDRLRFDFTNFKGLTKKELDLVEQNVNEWILDNIDVTVDNLNYKEAIKRGATALFNEKYGDEVRMVGIGDISLELCGGTHVMKTGDIGFFKIVSETGIAAGVRRIEALSGMAAYEYVKSMEDKLDELGGIYKCSPNDVVDKTQKLIAANKRLEKEIGALQASIANDDVLGTLEQVKEVNGIKVLSAYIDNKETKYLREYLDMFRDKLGSAVIVLASEHKGKVAMIACVTKDLTSSRHAGKILKSVLGKFGGRGGGREDMAQGGGIKRADVQKALEMVYDLV